jgi:hypothetical protein
MPDLENMYMSIRITNLDTSTEPRRFASEELERYLRQMEIEETHITLAVDSKSASAMKVTSGNRTVPEGSALHPEAIWGWSSAFTRSCVTWAGAVSAALALMVNIFPGDMPWIPCNTPCAGSRNSGIVESSLPQ